MFAANKFWLVVALVVLFAGCRCLDNCRDCWTPNNWCWGNTCTTAHAAPVVHLPPTLTAHP